ncbi:MAG: rhomboid family intramembrane serine protease, partial [Spirochaetes bacterium]|nr:rhomboid family intramembrane serine protease [Spirochaetota bacterium]
MIKKNISGSAIIKAIIYTNVCFFIISLLITGSNIKLNLHPFTALTPSTKCLILLGASGTIPIDRYHEWWSLITANFLHGSLLHIIFNMLALNQVASMVSAVYGRYRMFIIFIITGIIGFYISYLAGIEVTIGASASVCGLIGATLYYGKSRGGILGETVYRQTFGWVIFIILFGILVPNVNNWGHGGGLVSGIILGWILRYNERLVENKSHKIFSILLMGLTFCTLVWSL